MTRPKFDFGDFVNKLTDTQDDIDDGVFRVVKTSNYDETTNSWICTIQDDFGCYKISENELVLNTLGHHIHFMSKLLKDIFYYVSKSKDVLPDQVNSIDKARTILFNSLLIPTPKIPCGHLMYVKKENKYGLRGKPLYDITESEWMYTMYENNQTFYESELELIFIREHKLFTASGIELDQSNRYKMKEQNDKI